ncbi:MAG: GNAT family N-acetyltransferase [Candidatus Nanoarchaeia archaeon]|nr:GNAT family N-acetyltransferase [Candidatus Nanoarchaeia archaeon]
MQIKNKRIDANGIKFFIEKDGREIARAYLYLMYNDMHEKPFGLLEDVFVEESLRGQGIGTKLTQEIIKEAGKVCYKLICTSRYSREKVHSLYQKLGFKDHGKEFRIDF